MRWVSHASIFFPHQSAVPDLCGPDGGPDGGLRLDHHSGGPGALYHADLRRFCGLGPLRGQAGHLGGGGLPPAGTGGAAGVCRVFQRSGRPAGAHGRVPGGLSGLCPGVLGGGGQVGQVPAGDGPGHGAGPGGVLCLWHGLVPPGVHRRGERGDPAGGPDPVRVPLHPPRPGEDRPGPRPDPAGGEVRAGITFL